MKTKTLNGKLIFGMILIGMIICSGTVFAKHTATVTISPDIANCNELGNTFTVTVTNNAGSADDILQVEIYKALTGLSSFTCGPAPSGWTLFEYTDRCIYVTGLNSPDKIGPGESLDFTFDAVMSSNSCTSDFIVVSVDDAEPTGDRVTNTVSVSIDCSAPVITKTVGDPKLPGNGFDWWITQNTQIDITGSDSGNCDLGMDYCRWRYRVDNGTWSDWENHTPGCDGNVSFTISFGEDSVHDIQIECYDIAGNKATLNETDKVDSTPPETNKTYGTPFYSDGTYDWITSSTPIDLMATDGGNICAVGVDKLYYRITKLDILDKDCVAACNFNGDDFNGGPYGWQSVNGTHVQFTIDEESCHLIEFYTVDKLGNTEEVNRQCVFVDNKPPVGTKTIGDPKKQCEDGEDCDYWVSQNTQINLTCTDQQPHPVDNEKVCYKIYVDNNDKTECYCSHYNGSYNQTTGYCCFFKQTTLNFLEDSNHTLEYYCEDALGNKNEVDVEKFKVDSQPPVITKTMIGSDHLGDCPPTGLDDICYVKDDGENGVHIDVKDNQTYPECAIGVDYCNYGLWWYTDETTCKNKYGEKAWDGCKCLVDSGSFSEEGNIYFTEDSTHELYISCWDLLGNQMPIDVETFKVDSTPPETNKTYGTPFYSDGTYDWITSSTPITLTATDEKVGVDYIKYRYCLYSGCYESCGCDCEGDNWTTVYNNTVTFTIPNESEHCIEYYAVDKLGNVEDTKSQCVYVDNTPPHSVKEHDGILIEGDGFNWTTNETLITLDCEDPEPHPVSEETLCFKVSLDDDGLTYITYKYCSEFGGTYNETTGYCCVYVGEEPGESENKFTFHFLEDSCHNLEYYCVDYLGNDERDLMDGKPHIQWYKVDSVPPTTTKTYIPDAYVDPETGYEYIDTIHNVSLTAQDGGDICAIGVDKIQYRVSGPLADVFCEQCENWMNMLTPDIGPWNNYIGPFKIPEESCHVIEYRSIDKLGNTEDIKWQCVFVDKTPPVTNKYYEGPQWPEDNDDVPKWISSETLVVLDPYDLGPHPSGVNKTWYRDVYLENESDWHYCYSDCDEWVNDSKGRATVWDIVNGLPTAPEPYNPSSSRGFMLYEEPFTLPNESCHIIEYYSYDNVGKVEQVKHQCVFVDNTPPTPNKTVGDPKTEWDGQDSTFYPEIKDLCWKENGIECWKVTLTTPITLDCIDQEPHPVDHEETCFRVEVDGDDKTEYYCNGTYNKYGMDSAVE